MKPRIAFCFSGQARTLDITYILFQKNLFESAKEQGFDYDVFCAVEDDEDIRKVDLLNPNEIEKINSKKVKIKIDKKWGKSILKDVFEGKYNFDSKKNQSIYNAIYNFLQQIYKVQKSIELEQNYALKNGLKYDLIVRLRFDCMLMRKINFINMLSEVKKHSLICNKAVTFSKLIFKWSIHDIFYLKIHDFFFFGNHESFNKLLNIFDNIDKGFKGNEIKYKRCKKIFYNIEKFILNFNKSIGFRLIPVEPIRAIGVYFSKPITPESVLYYFFVYNKIQLKLERFSFFLYKTNVSESFIRLENKNHYEF